MPPLNLKY